MVGHTEWRGFYCFKRSEGATRYSCTFLYFLYFYVLSDSVFWISCHVGLRRGNVVYNSRDLQPGTASFL